jgi:Flp pilus assembly protein TadD
LRLATIVLLIALPGCLPFGTAVPEGPQPPGLDTGGEAVDGLLVGHRFMEAREYEAARKSYLRAAAETGLTADVLSALGAADLKLGRLGTAEDRLREALALEPASVTALNNLGVVLMEQGRFPEASEFFRAAFAADSGKSDDIRANLARALSLKDSVGYVPDEDNGFALVRRGNSEYRILARN